MLGEANTVGDLDVAAELVAKTEDRELFQAWSMERLRAALAAGRRLDSLVEQVTWPTEEGLRYLQGRSAVLSLTTTADRGPSGHRIAAALRAVGEGGLSYGGESRVVVCRLRSRAGLLVRRDKPAWRRRRKSSTSKG